MMVRWTIYFGPEPEKGKEDNWLRTDPERRFFSCWVASTDRNPRYSTAALFLNDIEPGN